MLGSSPIVIVDKIDENIIRIMYFIQLYLFICLLLKIIKPDIMFLSDIQNTISWQSSLLVCVGIEFYLGDRGERDKGTGIVFQKRIKQIYRERPYPEISKTTWTIEKYKRLYRMILGKFQKNRSKPIFYTITFEKFFILIIKHMDIITRDIYKKHKNFIKNKYFSKLGPILYINLANLQAN